MARPPEQRLREYKYRFSQSVVFGLPVIALQVYGRALGPAEADRWVSLFQSLLAGWVLYVNLGMFFEGAVLLAGPRKLSGDFLVAAVAILLYAASLVSAVYGIATGRLLYRPLMFVACVLVLMAWSGLRWFALSRRAPAFADDNP